MPWITVDNRSAVLGQAAFDLSGAADKALEVLPDGKVWGVARGRVVGTVLVNVVMAALLGAHTGKRLYEYLRNLRITFAGFKRAAFDCGGRFLRFRAAAIRGKLANADPATIADTDQTNLSNRLIWIFDLQDERLGEYKNDPVPQLSALRAIEFDLAELGIVGITFASSTLALELELIPVDAHKVAAPQTCVIEANAGSGSAADTRMVIAPRPDAIIALSLAYKGNNPAAGPLENAQIDETAVINSLDIEGKNHIRNQTTRSMLERHNAAVPYDAAIDESTTAPMVLPLVFPESGPTDAAHLIQTRAGGVVEFATTPSESANVAGAVPVLWIDGYNGVDNKSDHEDSYAMEALGIPRGTPVAVTSKALGKVPSERVAPFISRTIRPLR